MQETRSLASKRTIGDLLMPMLRCFSDSITSVNLQGVLEQENHAHPLKKFGGCNEPRGEEKTGTKEHMRKEQFQIPTVASGRQ